MNVTWLRTLMSWLLSLKKLAAADNPDDPGDESYDDSGDSNFDDDQGPPNSFRNLTVHPSINDLYSHQAGYLRELKTVGPFDSAEQYLDTNFRLLKEDFMKDLREAI